MALRIACQALPTPGSQRHATNVPAFMHPAKSVHARDVAVLASGSPFTSAQREATPGFWRPDCPPDEDEAWKGPFSGWTRKAVKKAARPAAGADTQRPTFRTTIEEVNWMNSRIQAQREDEGRPAKGFNPLRMLGL